MRRRRRRGGGASPFTLGALLAFVVVIVDQISKWWVLDVLMAPAPAPIEVTDFLNLVLVWNPGVSFGMFQHEAEWAPYILSGVAGLVVIFLLRWLATAETKLSAVALGLVIGGAIGNIVDRLRFGAVVDFIDFHAMGWHFWAFNVADAGISVGVALLLIDGLFGEGETS